LLFSFHSPSSACDSGECMVMAGCGQALRACGSWNGPAPPQHREARSPAAWRPHKGRQAVQGHLDA
jgi:hypothetical protein